MFDIGSIPDNATITQVQFILTKNTGGPGETNVYKLSDDWGEGTSLSGIRGGGQGASPSQGDATWINKFYDTDPWMSSGGDYAIASSASQNVMGDGEYTWSSNQMISDVQGWVDLPSSNYGWIIIGDESNNSSSVRYHSREAGDILGPKLKVTYIMDEACQTSITLDNSIASGAYQASETIHVFGSIAMMSQVVMTAPEVTLDLEFNIALGGELEILQVGCQP